MQCILGASKCLPWVGCWGHKICCYRAVCGLLVRSRSGCHSDHVQWGCRECYSRAQKWGGVGFAAALDAGSGRERWLQLFTRKSTNFAEI